MKKLLLILLSFSLIASYTEAIYIDPRDLLAIQQLVEKTVKKLKHIKKLKTK